MNYKSIYSSKPNDYFNGFNQSIVDLIPAKASKILDIGCSSGLLGKQIKLKYKETIVWGVEPNEYAAKNAINNIDYVINTLFDENINEHIGEQRFDVILFIDVIEHLVDPWGALKIAKTYLTPNGIIISSIPNILQYGTMYKIIKNQDWEYTETGIMDRTHLRFFTKKSIIKMFETVNLNVLNIFGHNDNSSLIFKILNFLFFKYFDDSKFTHFITVAKNK